MGDWFEVLATCLEAGLGMPVTFELARASSVDDRVGRSCEMALEAIEHGAGFSEAMARGGLLNGDERMALVAAERSGTLVEGLRRLAEELDARVRAGTRVVLVALGLVLTVAVVGFVAARVFREAMGLLPGQGGEFDELERRIMREAPFIYK